MSDIGTPVEHRRPAAAGRPAGHGLQLPGVLKDRKVQIGVAGAAVLGLVVLVRRGSGGAAGGTDAGAGTTPQSMSPAVMDSSGTDVYNAIQSLGQGWENDLRDYTSNLTNLQTGLTNLTTTVGKLGPVKAPAATTVRPLDKTLKTGQGFGIIKAGDTQATIAKRYGLTVSKLTQLNPGGLLSHFGVGEAVRVRAVAGPAPKSKTGVSLWR